MYMAKDLDPAGVLYRQDTVRKVAWVASAQVQVLAKDVGHFDVYMGAAFEEVVAEQLSFLQVRLHSQWKTGEMLHQFKPPERCIDTRAEEICSVRKCVLWHFTCKDVDVPEPRPQPLLLLVVS